MWRSRCVAKRLWLLLKSTISTSQLARKVSVADASTLWSESIRLPSFFSDFFLDPQTDKAVIKYSKMGGLKYNNLIDAQQKGQQDAMHTIEIDPMSHIRMDTLLEVASNLQIESQKSQMTFLLKHLYDFFIAKDVEIMELNPVVLGQDE